MPRKKDPQEMSATELFRVGNARRTYGKRERVAETVTRARSASEARKKVSGRQGVERVIRVLPLERRFAIVPEGEGNRPAPLRPGPDLTDAPEERRETTARSLEDPNRLYRFEYQLVSLEDLRTSHDDNFTVNPGYPAELQPRSRDRAASQLQVAKIANSLSPEALLSDTQQLDRGPAIVGGDMAVESGNGRVMALRLAKNEVPEKWQEYQDALREQLTVYGFTPEDYERIKDPVLVRERLSDVDRARFAAEANQSAVLTMSPLEQARQDSQRLSSEALNTLTVGESQSLEQALLSPSNRPLVTAFLESVPGNERATLLTAEGQLNQLGLQRLKAAMFTRTYPGAAGERLANVFFESTDPLVKTMENGLFASLPAMAKTEELLRQEHRDPRLSIAEDLSKAVDMLARLKEQRIPVEDYLKQSAMFERELTPFQEQLLEHLNGMGRSSKRVREFISNYAARVEDSPVPGQGTMFDFRPPSKEELVQRVMDQDREQQGLGQGQLLGAESFPPERPVFGNQPGKKSTLTQPPSRPLEPPKPRRSNPMRTRRF